MTLTDLLLWLGLAAAGIVACTAIVGGIRWYVVRADARTYLVPVADRMVWLPPAHPFVPVGDLGYAKPTPEPVAIPAPTPNEVGASAWVLDELANARKNASDTYATLGEFARPVPTAGALIWAEIDGATRGRELWAQWRPDWIGASA